SGRRRPSSMSTWFAGREPTAGDHDLMAAPASTPECGDHGPTQTLEVVGRGRDPAPEQARYAPAVRVLRGVEEAELSREEPHVLDVLLGAAVRLQAQRRTRTGDPDGLPRVDHRRRREGAPVRLL